MDILENRQTEIDKAVENIENFRLEQLDLFNRETASVKPQNKTRVLFFILAAIALGVLLYIKLLPSFVVVFLIVCFLIVCFSLLVPSSSSTSSKVHYNIYQQIAKKKLMEAIFPNIKYATSAHYFEITIKDSLLLLDNNFSIKDHFNGNTKNGYFFEFAEVESSNKNAAAFKGFFFAIKSTDLSCEKIIILRKILMVGKNLDDLTSVSFNAVLPKFETIYTVFSQNEYEAKKLLTADFLQQIYELSDKWNAEIRWSFVGNQICVAIKTDKDLFPKPNMFRNSSHTNNWAKNFCNQAALYIDTIENMSLQLEQIPEKIKIELKETKIKPRNDEQNSAYDHLIE